MSDIETRLDSDLHAAARRIQPGQLRGLQPPGHRMRNRRSRAIRFLAPAAAALAAVGVVAGLRATIGSGAANPANPASPAGSQPPFYVSGQGPIFTAGGRFAVSDPTGRVLASIVRPGEVPVDVAAVAGDSQFLLAFQSLPTTVTTFYEVTLSPAGKPGPLRRLPLPTLHGGPAVDMAVSPDGSTLALAVFARGSSPHTTDRVVLYSLRTGRAVRSWTAPGDTIRRVSWLDGSGTLLVDETAPGQGGSSGALDQPWVLRVSAPAGPLASHTTLLRLSPVRGATFGAVATGPGDRVVAWSAPVAGSITAQVTASLSAYSTQTGKLLQVLCTVRSWVGDVVLNTEVAADASGSDLLIAGPAGLTCGPAAQQVAQEPAGGTATSSALVFGRLDNGQFTRLAGPPPISLGYLLPFAW
jgi:hypothetical protein